MIPRIAEIRGIGKDLVNLTLMLWFVSSSIFILVSGSLTDKYGHKPVFYSQLTLSRAEITLFKKSTIPLEFLQSATSKPTKKLQVD